MSTTVLIIEVVYISKLKLPVCPFCKYRLSFLEAFINKNRAVYKCRLCQRKSSVNLNSSIFKLLWCLQILSILIFIMTLIGGGVFLILGFLIIFSLFLGFYFISAYMVRLEEPMYVSVKNEKERDKKSNKKASLQKEKIFDNEEDIDIYSN